MSAYRLAPAVLLLTAYCLLLTSSCGGDDKKDGGSSSGGSAKARVEATYRQWLDIRCEVSFACGGGYGAEFGSAEACKAQMFEAETHFLGKEIAHSSGVFSKEESCYEAFVDSYEACKNTVSARSPQSLCPYYGKLTFTAANLSTTIFDVFPECGSALADIQSVETQCRFGPQGFLGAPQRGER